MILKASYCNKIIFLLMTMTDPNNVKKSGCKFGFVV